MKNIIFVFAVSFCAMFAANVALATAPEGDTPGEYDDEYKKDMGKPHDVFTNLPLTGVESDGIAGVSYVNRAVNSAGAAATAAEAHAAAAGAYAVSAKASAGEAQAAADNAAAALLLKQDKLTAGANITITDKGMISATVPTASTSALGGVKVGTNLSIDNNGVLSATVPTASNETLGGVKVGANLSIDDDGVLSATDTTYTAGDNITITDGEISATVPTGALASKNTITNADVAADAAIAQSKIDGLTTALSGKQDTLTAGTNITIENGTISATVPTPDKATTTTAGIGKLYDEAGENTDGAMTQKSVTAALKDKADKNDIPTGALASLNAVDSAHITDGEVKTADIADGAVTSAKIADSAVTAIKTTGIIGKVPSGSEDSTTLASIWLQQFNPPFGGFFFVWC